MTGTAAYQYPVGPTELTTGSAQQSRLLQYAAATVDEKGTQGRQIAYAVANPGDRTISVKLALVDPSGTVADHAVVTPGPRQQIAEYLWQDPESGMFSGSLVFEVQAGESFVALACWMIRAS